MRVGVVRMTAATALAVAVLALAACAALPAAGSTPTPSPSTGYIAKPLPADPVVVAIGDSIMKGHGLPSADAWPAIIGAKNDWTIHNLACDGAGFSTVGAKYDCATTFASLVQEAETLKPDIVLISGSSNDLGFADDKLSAATAAAMRSLRTENPTARIIGISTVWGDTLTPPQIDDINDQVRAAVDEVGGTYLDIGQPLAGHRDWLQSDDVHPTAKGQRVLARVIAGALRSAKIVS
jgi:acyl-CoA thioesterase-1